MQSHSRPQTYNSISVEDSLFDEFLRPEVTIENMDKYHIRKSILDAITEQLPQFHGTLLDIGYGEMPYKNFILAHSNVEKYIGLDIHNPSYQEKTKPDLFWNGDKIPIEDNLVDGVVATEFFEHVPYLEKVLEEIRRVMKPGGILFFTVPFIWPLHTMPHDEYRYTPFSLDRLLRKSGFGSIAIKSTGGWNASFAQVLGLWTRRKKMSIEERESVSEMLFPLYKSLIESDQIPAGFGESMLITGLSGTARKATGKILERQASFARGNDGSVECPICGSMYPAFSPYGVTQRPNVLCPACSSLERHRLLWLYLKARTDIFNKHLSVLDIAPMKSISDRLRKLPNLSYLSIDLGSSIAMKHMDLTSLDLPDNSFDCILCYHVLEHIPDDRKAIREIRRVLKPEGWAIIQVPINKELAVTHEGTHIADPAERRRLFGQEDHVRYYGLDYEHKLRQEGFDVRVDDYVKTLGDEDIQRFGLDSNEDIYLCTKSPSYHTSVTTLRETSVMRSLKNNTNNFDVCPIISPQIGDTSETLIRKHTGYLSPMKDKKGSCLAIVTPYVGKISETFIRRQIENLAPGRTVVLAGALVDISWLKPPLLSIPLTNGRAKYDHAQERKVTEFLEKHGVTHILCQFGSSETEIVELNARRLHLPIFVHFHGYDASLTLRDPKMVDYYRWMGQNVTGIIAVSEVMRSRLVELGISDKIVHCIHYGVRIPEGTCIRTSKGVVNLLSVIRFVPKKGPLLLLDALRKAHAVEPNLKLDIVGDGPLHDEAEKFIDENKMSGYVQLYGAQPFEFTRERFQQADIYIQHSITDPRTGDAEGLPNAILEASSYGLPVVSTFHEGIPEAVEHNTTGFLVQEGDVDGMADCILKLARDIKLREAMGLAARKKMASEFTIEQQMDSLRKVMNLPKTEHMEEIRQVSSHVKDLQDFGELLTDAESAIQSKDLESAQQILYTILAHNPKDTAALNDLAVVKILTKDFQSAAETIGAILDIDPDDGVAKKNLKILKNMLVQELNDQKSVQDNRGVSFENAQTLFKPRVSGGKIDDGPKLDESPLVSVIIPSYNYAHLLPEAVESVVSQTFSDWEIIIVNDGSPDNTSEVAGKLIERHPDKRIYLLEKENSNASIARNAGIRASHGKYILPLDADDYIAPTMLEKTVPVLNTHPNIGFVYTHVKFFGDMEYEWTKPDFDRNALVFGNNLVGGPSALFRRSIWEKAGGYNESMSGYEDWDFWIGCVDQGWEGYCVHELLFYYRRHGGSKVAKSNRKRELLIAQIALNHPRLYGGLTQELAGKVVELSSEAVHHVRKPSTMVDVNRSDSAFEAQLSFWKELFSTRPDSWKGELSFRLRPDTILQETITKLTGVPPEGVLRLLDVGAGPLTAFGKRWDGCSVQITAVDPLAKQYEALLKQFGISAPVPTIHGNAETLTDHFQLNYFDAAFTQSSMECSMDPPQAIDQMLAVVKTGGWVFLGLPMAEAGSKNSREQQKWNFIAEDGDFIVTGQSGQRLNLTRQYAGIARVICEPYPAGKRMNVRMKKLIPSVLDDHGLLSAGVCAQTTTKKKEKATGKIDEGNLKEDERVLKLISPQKVFEKYDGELKWWRDRFKDDNGKFKNSHFKQIMLAMAQETEENFLAGKIVADFGCGPRGSLSWAGTALLRIGIDVLSDKYADEFGENITSHGMIYVKSTEEVIPLPSGFVDIMFTMNAMDHVKNFPRMCNEVLRVLKPGGEFIGSFNLNEPPTACEPWQLNEEIIYDCLLKNLKILSRRITKQVFDRSKGFYDPFFTVLLPYDPDKPGVLWVRARKDIGESQPQMSDVPFQQAGLQSEEPIRETSFSSGKDSSSTQRVNVSGEMKGQKKIGSVASTARVSSSPHKSPASVSGLICLQPFHFVEFAVNGNVYTCCPAWVKFPIGNIKRNSLEQIWNSSSAQLLRAKMYQKDWKGVCNELCGNLGQYKYEGKVFRIEDLDKIDYLTPELVEEIREERIQLESFPTTFNFSNSTVCNLDCIMCPRHQTKTDHEMVRKTHDDVSKYLGSARKLILTGNGDPLARADSRELLINYRANPDLQIVMLTNGLLLPKYWNKIKHQRFQRFHVSVDAATKPTYEKIRRGGKWEILLEAFEILKENNSRSLTTINMTVMRSNYREIPAFVEIAERYGFNAMFRRVRDHWGDENIFDLKDQEALAGLRSIISSVNATRRITRVVWEDLHEFASL